MCGLTIVLSEPVILSVNGRAGHLMGQNGKVVHWPDKPLETVELPPMIQEGIIQLRALARLQPSFCHFEPYIVRFEPITVLVVHVEANKMAHFCMNGPMDRNSVKNCATVA